jgi:glutathione-regulated potassium-efflux system ancillary protein KefG
MTKILVLAFHPRLEASKINATLLHQLRQQDSIVVKDMYELYPDYNIDIKAEQASLLEADLVVMLHPFYWYSAPPLCKQWIDLVLEHGWAYGRGGDKLNGKKIFHVISSGGNFEMYSQGGKNLYTYIELLRPFELTYRLCQMQQLPPYIIPNAYRITPEEVALHADKVSTLLNRWSLSNADFSLSDQVLYLNDLN